MADGMFWWICLRIFRIGILLAILSSLSEGKVVQLTEDNWKQILEGEWMIKFYAPWCPACQHIASTWSAFALKGKQMDINVAEVDVTTQSSLSGRFMVASLPTIYHVQDGAFRVYSGSRSLDEFIDFVKESKWRDINPVPSWKSPGSYLMGCLGLMFKLSLSLKNLHDHVTTTYGLPVWASITLFGVATILVGVIFGVVTVYIADYFFDKPPSKPRPTELQKKEENDKDTPQEETPGVENEEKDSAVRKRKVNGTTD